MVILFRMKESFINEDDEALLRTQIEKLIPKMEQLKETMRQLTNLVWAEVNVRIWLKGLDYEDYILEATQQCLNPYQIFLQLKAPDHGITECYADVWIKDVTASFKEYDEDSKEVLDALLEGVPLSIIRGDHIKK